MPIRGQDSRAVDTSLDRAFQRLIRAQGAPSYVLVMWLMSKQRELELNDGHIEAVVDLLTSFFVRRNLTGYPQTYALAKLFMTTIDAVGDARADAVLAVVSQRLSAVSATDNQFRERLLGQIYEENTDVARFVLATLAEDAMTRETTVDLWLQEKGYFVWTIEHILPQGENLPSAWQEMLGGEDVAARCRRSTSIDWGTSRSLPTTATSATSRSSRIGTAKTQRDGTLGTAMDCR